MTLTVLLFGREADIAGCSALRVDVREQRITCAQLRQHLLRAAPRLAQALRTARFAVNHAYADDSAMVGEGDEIALIGMVSGG